MQSTIDPDHETIMHDSTPPGALGPGHFRAMQQDDLFRFLRENAHGTDRMALDELERRLKDAVRHEAMNDMDARSHRRRYVRAARRARKLAKMANTLRRVIDRLLDDA